MLFTIIPVVILIGILATSTFIRTAMLECKRFSKVEFPPNSQPKSKVVVVTGANSGLGYYSSLDIAKAGATVVLACRTLSKCKKAKSDILSAVPDASVIAMQLDLSSFDSVHKFVNEFKAEFEYIDVLVNNAGIMAIPTREVTKDGLESQIGTNHFGHFLLTGLLYPLFREDGRIINHSSEAHNFPASKFPFEELYSEKTYSPFVAYGNSKIANLYFTFELNRRLEAAGNPKRLISIAVHPGYTATNLQEGKFPLWKYANNLMAMSGEDGSLAQTYAAIGDKVSASMNNYLGPKYSIFGAPAVAKTSHKSSDLNAAAFLWDESVKVTGVDIPYENA